MEIRLASLLQGAREAEGTTIIIDVFRAFTTAAVAFDRGTDKIVLVAEPEEALALRRRGIGELCLGEVDGIKPAIRGSGVSAMRSARPKALNMVSI